MIEVYDPTIHESFTIQKCGIAPIGEPTYEQWLALGEFIRHADARIHFWIGDWLNYGENVWGKMYEEAIEQTGFDYGTLRDDKWVSSRIELSRRRDNLSFAHHREVASCTPQEQEILLERAVSLKLSTAQLRKEKERLRNKTVQPGEVWKLENHLLYCGDSSDETFKNLCRQSEAGFAFADPPYNAGVAEWDHDFAWQHDYLLEVAPVVAVTPGIASLQSFLRTTDMPYLWAMSCWINNGMTRGALGFGNWICIALFGHGSLYHNAQDFLQVVEEDDKGFAVSISGADKDELDHKGRKPLAMMRRLVTLFAPEGSAVIDSFLGTGTTLIACEKEGRACVGAEINPEYCQAIIKRWEALTGKIAEVV